MKNRPILFSSKHENEELALLLHHHPHHLLLWLVVRVYRVRKGFAVARAGAVVTWLLRTGNGAEVVSTGTYRHPHQRPSWHYQDRWVSLYVPILHSFNLITTVAYRRIIPYVDSITQRLYSMNPTCLILFYINILFTVFHSFEIKRNRDNEVIPNQKNLLKNIC